MELMDAVHATHNRSKRPRGRPVKLHADKGFHFDFRRHYSGIIAPDCAFRGRMFLHGTEAGRANQKRFIFDGLDGRSGGI